MDTVQRYRVVEVDWLAASPVGPHAVAFERHLTERRYATHTIASYIAEVTHFARCSRSNREIVARRRQTATPARAGAHPGQFKRVAAGGAVSGQSLECVACKPSVGTLPDTRWAPVYFFIVKVTPVDQAPYKAVREDGECLLTALAAEPDGPTGYAAVQSASPRPMAQMRPSRTSRTTSVAPPRETPSPATGGRRRRSVAMARELRRMRFFIVLTGPQIPRGRGRLPQSDVSAASALAEAPPPGIQLPAVPPGDRRQ